MGALTLIQSGFFSAATSGRWAFSGWRGLLVASSTTVMAAPQLTYGCRAVGARRPRHGPASLQAYERRCRSPQQANAAARPQRHSRSPATLSPHVLVEEDACPASPVSPSSAA